MIQEIREKPCGHSKIRMAFLNGKAQKVFRLKRRFLLPVLALLCLYIAEILYSQGKGGRWQFENNGNDTAQWDASNDSGTLQGEADYMSASPLPEGTACLWLDTLSVHDFFRIEDSDDLDFLNESIGISAWIYPVRVGDDVHWIINKGDQFPLPKTTNYALRLNRTGNLEFLIRDAQNKARPVASRFTIPENQWTFVGIFYEYSAGKIYMWNTPSEVPSDTLDYSQDFFPNSDPLSIGSWFTSDTALISIKDFEGGIDDVRIGTRIDHILSGETKVHSPEPASDPGFLLYPNFPNPFNGTTRITFDLKRQAMVSLHIFDNLGRLRITLVHRHLNPGNHVYVLDASRWPSAVYFFRLEVNNKKHTGKMHLVR
jgi:hypothetical protein